MEKHKTKVFDIISFEYMTKLRSKGFIISTLLGPLMLVVFFGVIALVTLISEDSTERKIAIVDKSGRIGQKVVQNEPDKYFISDQSVDSLYSKVLREELDGYLVIDKDFVENGKADVYSLGGGGIGFISSVNASIGGILRNERLIEAGIAPEVIAKVDKRPDISTHKITEKGTENDYAGFYAVIGYVLGFVIYIMMLIYGASVMRGVIEEKANRIIEVMASSVRPFELMMGKVVGIGLLGLTQLTFWLILGAVLFWLKGDIISLFASPNVQMAATMGGATGGPDQEFLATVASLPAPSIGLVLSFVFYFLTGYFVYATLFAAIGSAVDQESDAQQLQLPVTLPIIIPMLFIQYIMSNPESTLSIILSLFPFFSPILMIVRIAATEVPLWEIALSVVLMIGTFFLCIMFAAKVYRIGILMYGRKPQLKDLIKWIRISN